jgi:hypothetical protein
MDESLRRAYLAAMDVPLWIPRDAAEAEAVARASSLVREPVPPAAVVPGPVRSSAAARGGGSARAQALLDAAPPATPGRVASVVPRAPRPATVAGERLALCFACAGSTLFVDQLPAARADDRARELYGALVFVLERAHAQPHLQQFEWPPNGVAWEVAEARDAVLGRIRKITEGAALRRLVLMGPAPARLLFGWSEDEFARRAAAVRRLETLDCAVLVTPAAEELLREPALKRLAWQTLRLAMPADG